MDCMKDNTTYVRNIKKYLLAALYNAPTTINSYYPIRLGVPLMWLMLSHRQQERIR